MFLWSKENVRIVKEIKYKHIILLASNCMAIKAIDLQKMNPTNDCAHTYEEVVIHELWSHWRNFVDNELLIQELKKDGVKNLLRFHEGAIFFKNIAEEIESKIMHYSKYIHNELTCFEEILLPSVEHKITGKHVRRTCYVDFEHDITLERVNELEKIEKYIFC